MRSVPRVINEFEGGPVELYCGMGIKSPYDGYPYIVLNSCKSHPIFNELKITPTIESLSQKSVTLFDECEEECDNCEPDTCPRPIEEVGEKGSGMQVREVLKGWFIDFNNCIRWKVCECCKGTGYLNKD